MAPFTIADSCQSEKKRVIGAYYKIIQIIQKAKK